MDLSMTGRTYIVSGGSRGIGRAVVRSLLAEGARVATFARAVGPDPDPSTRDRLLTGTCDVRDAEAVRAFVAEAVRWSGRLDGVVANAGAGATGDVLRTPPDVWADQFEIKVRGALNLVEHAVEHLAASDAGAVVVLNGVTARSPDADMAAVSASRAALAAVVTLLGRRLAPADVRVNTVNLGAIATDRQRRRHAESGSPSGYDEWCTQEARRRGIPLRRFGRPEEVAAAVTYLLSPVAGYVTGASVDVAGGLGAWT